MTSPRFLSLFTFFGIAAILLIGAQTSEAQQHPFEIGLTRLVDTNTAVPGTFEPFNNFQDAVIDGDRILFAGGVNNANGIFSTTLGGPVETVVQDGSLTFFQGTTFRDLSISGDEVAFFANIPFVPGSGLSNGIFVQDLANNTTRLIVNGNSLVPGTNRDFDRIDEFAISNGTVVFAGDDSLPPFPQDLFLDQGNGLELIASASDVGASGIIDVEIDGSNVFFTTISPGGLFVVDPNGQITNLVSGSQPDDLSVSDGNIAFDDGSLTTLVNGQLTDLVSGGDPIPETNDTFALLEDIALDGENIAFFGNDSFNTGNVDGLFAVIDGKVVTLLRENDLLEGQLVDGFSISSDAFSDDQIVFTVHFQDGSEAVFWPASLPRFPYRRSSCR